jgi:tRNA (mo5U34)-methyltransferase
MEHEELSRRIQEIRWHHSIDLGNGLVTPGNVDNMTKLARLGFPERFDGLSVLDIGAWDGFYSFEAERRGADRVLATDHFCWNGPGPGTKQGFDLAHQALGSRVEQLEIDPLDLDREQIGEFDVVLFLGVLYHLKYPMEVLERVAAVTRKGGLAIIETHVDMLHLLRPAMAFYPGRELGNDPTNWIGPNPAAVIGMATAAGFEDCAVHPVSEGRPETLERLRTAALSDLEAHTGRRMVFHARR